MNLCKQLAIAHSVLIDSDNNKGIQGVFNEFINLGKNKFTKGIHIFDTDIEGFLEVEAPNRKDFKPLNIMYKYKNGEIADEKIEKLKNIF